MLPTKTKHRLIVLGVGTMGKKLLRHSKDSDVTDTGTSSCKVSALSIGVGLCGCARAVENITVMLIY